MTPWPFCLQADNAAPSVFQLAPTSTGNGYRCLLAGLGSGEEFCQPPLVPDQQSPSPEMPTTDRGDPIGSSLEDPAMVPNTLGSASRSSLSDFSPGGPDDCSVSLPPSSTTTGCVKYLRGSIRVKQFQEKLWSSSSPPGEQTSKSYDYSVRDGLAGVIIRVQIPFQVQ